MAVLPAVLVLLGDWAFLADLRDDVFRQQVVTEMGVRYIACCLLLWNVPYGVAARLGASVRTARAARL